MNKTDKKIEIFKFLGYEYDDITSAWYKVNNSNGFITRQKITTHIEHFDFNFDFMIPLIKEILSHGYEIKLIPHIPKIRKAYENMNLNEMVNSVSDFCKDYNKLHNIINKKYEY